MQRGSVLSKVTILIILGALAYAIYYFYSNYSQTPNKTTQNAASAIYKYPDAKKWELKEAKNVCLLKGGNCSQPITITLESIASWPEVYGYYTRYLPQLGWTTNSSPITSTPTSVVFTKTQGDCKASLEPKSEAGGIYQFTVSCTGKSTTK